MSRQTALITGANRGIGLAFVRCLLERGNRVYAGCRTPDAAHELQALAKHLPDHCRIVELNVADAHSIAAARWAVGEREDTLDLLINNAGTFASGERGLFHLDATKIAHVFAVNATAPALVTQSFADLLERGTEPLVANLTSGVGLLTDNPGVAGGQYSYAASKAALNLIIRSLSFDLLPKRIAVVGIGPGYVQTDMTAGGTATLLPDESVRGMVKTLDRLTIDDTGRFFNYRNEEDLWMSPG